MNHTISKQAVKRSLNPFPQLRAEWEQGLYKAEPQTLMDRMEEILEEGFWEWVEKYKAGISPTDTVIIKDVIDVRPHALVQEEW